jgi:hypothetical protein
MIRRQKKSLPPFLLKTLGRVLGALPGCRLIKNEAANKKNDVPSKHFGFYPLLNFYAAEVWHRSLAVA